MDPTDDIATWKSRIDAARTRRQRYEALWGHYARLHTNAYHAIRDLNEDKNVSLPNGDQVKASLVFRNIEQTRALLEVPEIGVRATALDYTRELGTADTHRESVVEQALYHSLSYSSLLDEAEESDTVKLDGTVIGHGINYTAWRVEEEEVERPGVPILTEAEDGSFQPQLDAEGLPVTEPIREKQTTWEGCQDLCISPMQFLSDASCKKFHASPWHGFERPVKLALLRKDPRYNIPDHIQGVAFTLRDIYGVEGQVGEELTDAVMVIVIWDKVAKELLTFLETAPQGASGALGRATARASNKRTPDADLVPIAVQKWPVTFSHPDASPFSFYIPIPARDHPFGISQIEHVRNQAIEADKLRTRQANLTRQIKRVPWINANRITSKDEIRTALKSDDMEPVFLNLQEGEKPDQVFGELPVPGSVPADVYKQYLVAEQGVDKTTGVSDVPGGGADTATEAEHIFEIGGARTKRKKRLYLAFLTTVACRHRDFLREFSPEGELLVVPDVDGTPITLAYGRAAFEGRFKIEVVAGGGATAISPVRQKLMTELTALLLQKYGPAFDRVWLRQILTMTDARNINELMRAMSLGMGLPGMPGAPGGTVPMPGYSPENYSIPQTLRGGINAVNEGGITR